MIIELWCRLGEAFHGIDMGINIAHQLKAKDLCLGYVRGWQMAEYLRLLRVLHEMHSHFM